MKFRFYKKNNYIPTTFISKRYVPGEEAMVVEGWHVWPDWRPKAPIPRDCRVPVETTINRQCDSSPPPPKGGRWPKMWTMGPGTPHRVNSIFSLALFSFRIDFHASVSLRYARLMRPGTEFCTVAVKNGRFTVLVLV